MKQIKITVILISIWTFVTVLNVIATSSINWTKYRYETGNYGITCSSAESLFIRNDVSDEMACSKMCFMHSKCLTSVYQPETLRCIGCNRKGFQDASPNATDSIIQYTRRDFYIDCKDILAKQKDADSGVYEITLLNSEEISVLCDMWTEGGGWTVIQTRIYGHSRRSFNESFESYQNGFGDLVGEFWLGLRNIQQLTDTRSRMRYYLYTSQHMNEIGTYGGFKLLGEDYTLYFEEDITGISTSWSLNSSQFFTYDHDSMGECAAKSGGGWWYPLANTSSGSCYVDDHYNLNANMMWLRGSNMMVRRK